ncbi:hypothetical protein [Vibrio sp. CAU 1672]|uniref:hypothetical protein n=1 Tax=Vibrio sp. CAU 1672 TaxID=3032594 RepID=UPI0023DC0BC1|nr:hypothetical protein [Vibrio sp. CAU 1672]MDF2153095.1 hypothetical protein [Vibrio sp. CAU 1672]
MISAAINNCNIFIMVKFMKQIENAYLNAVLGDDSGDCGLSGCSVLLFAEELHQGVHTGRS